MPSFLPGPDDVNPVHALLGDLIDEWTYAAGTVSIESQLMSAIGNLVPFSLSKSVANASGQVRAVLG